MKLQSNIYRDGGVWCHATWIGGEFDSSDPLTAECESEATGEVRALYPDAIQHDIRRVDDM